MRRDPTDTRRQEEEAEREALAASVQRAQEIEDFKHVASSVEGRRFLWRLLEKTGVYRSSFTGSSETFFREGQRNVGLFLIGEIHSICPEVYLTMLKEQQLNEN